MQRAWRAHCYGIAQAKWLEVIRAEQQRAAGIIQRRYGAKGGAKGGADAQKKGRRSTVGPTPHSTPARAGAGAPRDRAASIKPPAAERGSANGRSGSNRKRSTAPTATPTATPTAGMMPPTAAGRTPYTPRSSGAPSAAASISGDAPAAAAPAAAAPRKLFDGERRAAEGTSAELEAAAALIQGAAASALGPNSADLEAAAALIQGAAASALGPSSSGQGSTEIAALA